MRPSLTIHSRPFKQLLQSIVFFGMAARPAHASTEAVAVVDEEADEDDGRSFAILPGAFYSQETSVGFAAFGSYTFPVRGAGADTWPSTVTGTLVYTLENQASATLWTSIFLGALNDWAIESETFVEHFPTNYYGLGPDSKESFQLFTRRQLASDIAVRRRIRGPFYLGVADHLSVVDVLDAQGATTNGASMVWTADDQLGSGQVAGGDGSRTHGLGGLARWDTRDNNQASRSGALVDLELAGHPAWLGSSHPFTFAKLDVRGFVPLGKGALAAQSLTELGFGTAPFTAMPELGGDDLLRGMYQGRFRDRCATAAQLELRHPIVWRFHGAAFAGAGQVASTPDGLTANSPRWTAGGGLRFELDEDAHTRIRLDVGSGPDGTGFIINFGEAF